MTDSIPILVSAVTDPAASGLVESNEVPGGNVSGTSDLTPVKEQIDLMQQIIPDVKKGRASVLQRGGKLRSSD